ncbi:MAG: beta-ketoacyl-ACP synthase II [Candidatus Hydrogenedentes bacterium]|nr:beta-ketoacyl-ACP synthase II [Candidatus Hydrogenedentota bacterium]
MDTRVVVTGMGVVSPVGNEVIPFWRSLCEGRSGIRVIDRFDTSQLPVRIAGLAQECAPQDLSAKDVRRHDLYSIYAMVAADRAWAEAGIDLNRENPQRCGAVIGSGIGGLWTIEEQMTKFVQGGPRRVSPLMVPKVLTNMAAGDVAIRLGLQGPNKAVVSACASSNQSIGEAMSIIRSGYADVMLAGGAEAPVVPFGLSGFAQMKALSCRNNEPERASRPFDKDRDGFVMGEGAGILVMESEAHARSRGAQIIGEVAGHGETCDAYHVTAPRPDASGAVTAMLSALQDAGLPPAAVDYFNAHGTSTKYNDSAEALALRKVFGDDMPLVSSTKSMTGHLLGAAGAIEAVACLLAIRDGVVPPNINYDTPDPECVINVVANEARTAEVRVAMSNSLGFGGHNSSVILKKYE